MNEFSRLQIDVDAVRAAGVALFGSDLKGLKAWAKKARVSIVTLRTFLSDEYVKLETGEQIAAAAGCNIVKVLRVNGRKLA